jgi:hypothetical protein
MNDAKVLADCRQLSSGTIATLTGEPLYYQIDIIQQKFVEFVTAEQAKTPGCFETWQDAWKLFADTKLEPVVYGFTTKLGLTK